MKKFLLSFAVAALAFNASAVEKVFFEEDFEWLEPWALANDPEVGDCQGTNDPSVEAPQISKAKLVVDGKTAEQALIEKGYDFIRDCAADKTPGECIYLQKNYLRFGKTSYQGGIILPSIDVPEGTEVTLSFQWFTQRQGTGVIDPTELVVKVANGDDVKVFNVPTLDWESGHALVWEDATIVLEGAVVTKDTKITIINSDEQLKSSKALRWHLDNIKVYGDVDEVTDEPGGDTENEGAVLFEDDFEWLAPYAQAGKNGNGDPAAGDTVGTNGAVSEAPKADACVVDGKSALEAMQEKGYDLVSAHGFVNDKDKQDIAFYLQQNYLKFNKTGNVNGKPYQEGLVLPALQHVPTDAEISVEFDWCPQQQGSGMYDLTKMAVIVVNGEEEVEFAAPEYTWPDGADYSWTHAVVPLTGATVNETTKLIIRNTNEAWVDTTAHRFYLDNVKVLAAGSDDGSGVAEIITDVNAPVEFFNLQGVRVANPEKGIYIVKQGNKVSKKIFR